MENGIPRILIVRLSAIGDVVRVLPALHALRNAFPNAQIDWAVERKSADIVEGHPALDRVLIYERTNARTLDSARTFLEFCQRIRKSHYDMVIDFHGIFKSGLVSLFSRAPQRFGFARPRARELSYLFVNKRVKLGQQVLNRIEENLALSDFISPQHHTLDVTIDVPVEIQDHVNDFFDNTFDGGKLVVAMHVPVDRAEKQWPVEHFAALADFLLADGRFDVLLTWGPGQRAAVDEVIERTRRNPVVAPESPDLKHYAWLAHRSDLYFGSDTGPMHIASAMGAAVAAVFGGTDPARHAPYREPYEVLYTSDPGLNAKQRLEHITPEMAYDACVRLTVHRKEIKSGLGSYFS
ncbi:MAG: glycosyltransferase family 9 protein [Candidatus Hydrogenedentes bacterium]|nr:glycosyltransferase family 9 protein [Candidatus Hydrogenedentota bacterium]